MKIEKKKSHTLTGHVIAFLNRYCAHTSRPAITRPHNHLSVSDDVLRLLPMVAEGLEAGRGVRSRRALGARATPQRAVAQPRGHRGLTAAPTPPATGPRRSDNVIRRTSRAVT